MKILAVAQDGLEAVAAVESVRPDLAVVDDGLTDTSGSQTIYLIRETVPSCRILVITNSEDVLVVAEAIEAGANGCLPKTVSLDRLVQAIRAITRGETVVSPMILGPLLDYFMGRRLVTEAAVNLISRLTKREREVLAILAIGGSNETIAERLAISPETARTHIQNLLTKLNLHSRLEAAAFVNENAILGELMGVVR